MMWVEVGGVHMLLVVGNLALLALTVGLFVATVSLTKKPR
jgi:hypothetical protein